MKVKVVASQQSLGEAGQGNPVAKFAAINSKGETISPFFQCRDYINDLLWNHYTGEAINVHGYSCKVGEHKDLLKDGTFGIAVKILDNGKHVDITDEQFKGVRKLLESYTKALKFKPSEVVVSDDKKYIIIYVDKAWTPRPYVQSALLLLIRLGVTYDPKEDFFEQFDKGGSKKFISPHDNMYYKSSKHILKKLSNGEIDAKEVFSNKLQGYSVHNYGIVAYSRTHK